ncbi:hypothetical protein BY458DRAFT_202953 [Sporodiniella umbellata]|nr:hypothetical protein BY458DRAFT_202953 [Sporodiniella umbellata]
MQERQQLLDEINKLYKSQEELNGVLLTQKKENALQNKKLAELSSKIQYIEKDQKKQQAQNTRLKEEIAKEKNNTQYIRTQYAHETKRHEQSMQKLQERLLKAMNSQMKTNISSLDMNSHFATTLDYEADNDEVIQVRSMYADLLLKSTNRESASKKESEELRIALIQLYAGVRRLVEDKTVLFERQRHSKKKGAYQETTKLNLPMDCGGKEALQEANNLLARLREEWDYQLTKTPSEDLEEKLQEKENVIQSLESSMEELLQNIGKRYILEANGVFCF